MNTIKNVCLCVCGYAGIGGDRKKDGEGRLFDIYNFHRYALDKK